MRRKLLAAYLLLSSLAASASGGGINAMMIHCKSGESVTFLLDEMPVVKFSGDNLIVTTHMNVVNYPSEDVVKFTYANVDPDGLTSPSLHGAVFSFGKDFVRMGNLAPKSRVAIYAVDGKQIAAAVTDKKGCATLKLPGNTASVYIVKTQSSTFKISRP